MQIKEYLFYTGITQTQFAEMIGVSRRTIVSMMKGKCKSVRSKTMQNIKNVTSGRVSYEDIIQEVEKVRPIYPEIPTSRVSFFNKFVEK